MVGSDFGVVDAVVQRLQQDEEVGKGPFRAQIHLGQPKTQHWPMVIVDVQDMKVPWDRSPKLLIRLQLSILTQSLASMVHQHGVGVGQLFFLSCGVQRSLEAQPFLSGDTYLATARLECSEVDAHHPTKSRCAHHRYKVMVW
jgi:hypothetical protein